jgi:hypothetical protein
LPKSTNFILLRGTAYVGWMTTEKIGDVVSRISCCNKAKPVPPSSLRTALRYFFCAHSLAAASASEKSKIDAGATSPFKLAVEVSIAM